MLVCCQSMSAFYLNKRGGGVLHLSNFGTKEKLMPRSNAKLDKSKTQKKKLEVILIF